MAHPSDTMLANTISARGLVDTGASVTAICRNLAQKLGLEPEGKRVITNTHGQQQVTQYRFLAGFLVRLPASGASGGAAAPHMLPEVYGIDFTATASFDLLVGMDIIRQGNLLVRRSGEWSFEF